MSLNNNLSIALSLACRFHDGQYRQIRCSRVPYVVHPVAVFNQLLSNGEEDESVLCSALLHDSIEDSDDRERVSETIKAALGDRILSIVKELTLPEEITSASSPLSENLRKAKYDFISKSFKNGSLAAKKVKLADRICNVKDFISTGNKEYAFKYWDMFHKACFPVNVENKDAVFWKLLLEFVDIAF